MCRAVLTLAVALQLTHVVGAQDAVDPARVLKPMVGDWKTEITLKTAEWTPQETTIKGEMSIKLILGGRFIEETGRTLGEDVEHRVIWGYEPGRQVFRSWFFDSNGASLDWDGKWDEKKRTMTWEGDVPGGLRSYAEHRFLKPDYYEWTSVTKDKSGKVFLDMHGKHTRVKGGGDKARAQ